MSDSILERAEGDVDGAPSARSTAANPPNLRDPSLYINRELSWLEFNARVLELAEDKHQRLFERLKFLAIYTSNLDDFFMVRVAGVHGQIEARVDKRSIDGLTPARLMEAIAKRVRELDARQAHEFADVVRPALAEQRIRIVSCEESGAGPEQLEHHFREHIFPVLTPLAIGPGRPFPYISNLSLSLLVHLHDPALDTELYARVKVPREVIPRFVEISEDTFVPLEDIIAHHLDLLFPGMEVVSHALFRVTRDADFDISDEADDLLAAVEDELRRRRFGEVVRLEVGGDIEPGMLERLIEWLDLSDNEVYERPGLLDLSDLWQIVETRRPLRAAPELVDAGHPSGPETQAGGHRRRARHLRSDARVGIPRALPVPVVLDQRRAARAAGRRRPERARDQDDRVPDLRRFGPGSSPDHRRRERQAGGLHG